jgi:hypothetical protein
MARTRIRNRKSAGHYLVIIFMTADKCNYCLYAHRTGHHSLSNLKSEIFAKSSGSETNEVWKREAVSKSEFTTCCSISLCYSLFSVAPIHVVRMDRKQKVRIVVHAGVCLSFLMIQMALSFSTPSISTRRRSNNPLIDCFPLFGSNRKQQTANMGRSRNGIHLAMEGLWGASTASSRRLDSASAIALSSSAIDYQSDAKNYGRGDMHLSAALEENDVVVYLTGTWYVDGVQVGDGSPPAYRYALVDNVQIVWTHNCEHGVIRGFSLELVENNTDGDNDGRNFQRLIQLDGLVHDVESGPEQLVARIPVERASDSKENFIPHFRITDQLWEQVD